MVYVIEPELRFPGVEGYDFKVDKEFATEEEAEQYAADNQLTHYAVEKIIPRCDEWFKEIFARIPHGVKFRHDLGDGVETKPISFKGDYAPGCDILYTYWMRRGCLLPYLRRMSSMTEEERKTYESLCYWDKWETGPILTYKAAVWLMENHFDFNHLIDDGLAVEVTEDNNPYKDTD